VFGGGGGGAPPQQQPKVDETALAKQKSDAEAEARKLKRKRYGRQATRLTDPIVDLSNSRPNPSLLGGGEPPTSG